LVVGRVYGWIGRESVIGMLIVHCHGCDAVSFLGKDQSYKVWLHYGKSSEKFSDKPSGKSSDRFSDKSSERASDKSGDKSSDKSNYKSSHKSSNKPSEKSSAF
jgi:hypothetical protein